MAKKIKFLFLFTLLLFVLQSYSQIVVVRDPTWIATEEARVKLEMQQKAKEYALLSQQLTIHTDNFERIKEATKKLQKLNTRIRNFRHLEEAVSMTSSAYKRFGEFVKNIEMTNLFEVDEYMRITNHCLSILATTSYSVDVLSLVISDFGFEGNDYERLATLDLHLRNIRNDLNTLYLFMWEIEQLNNQRMQLRTLNYMKYKLSGQFYNNPGN